MYIYCAQYRTLLSNFFMKQFFFLIPTLQYLQKDLNLYQNLMLTALGHSLKAYFLFQAIILQDLEENQ